MLFEFCVQLVHFFWHRFEFSVAGRRGYDSSSSAPVPDPFVVDVEIDADPIPPLRSLKKYVYSLSQSGARSRSEGECTRCTVSLNQRFNRGAKVSVQDVHRSDQQGVPALKLDDAAEESVMLANRVRAPVDQRYAQPPAVYPQSLP